MDKSEKINKFIVILLITNLCIIVLSKFYKYELKTEEIVIVLLYTFMLGIFFRKTIVEKRTYFVLGHKRNDFLDDVKNLFSKNQDILGKEVKVEVLEKHINITGDKYKIRFNNFIKITFNDDIAVIKTNNKLIKLIDKQLDFKNETEIRG